MPRSLDDMLAGAAIVAGAFLLSHYVPIEALRYALVGWG